MKKELLNKLAETVSSYVLKRHSLQMTTPEYSSIAHLPAFLKDADAYSSTLIGGQYPPVEIYMYILPGSPFLL